MPVVVAGDEIRGARLEKYETPIGADPLGTRLEASDVKATKRSSALATPPPLPPFAGASTPADAAAPARVCPETTATANTIRPAEASSSRWKRKHLRIRTSTPSDPRIYRILATLFPDPTSGG
jgi:hypothetical protein